MVLLLSLSVQRVDVESSARLGMRIIGFFVSSQGIDQEPPSVSDIASRFSATNRSITHRNETISYEFGDKPYAFVTTLLAKNIVGALCPGGTMEIDMNMTLTNTKAAPNRAAMPLILLTLSCPLAGNALAENQGVPTSTMPANGTTFAQRVGLRTEGPDYPYQLYFEDSEMSVHANVDPFAPAGERVTIVSPISGEKPDDFDAGVAELDANPTEDFWCSGLADMVPTDARLVADTADTMEFSFVPLADPDDEDDAALMEHLTGQVTIDKRLSAIRSFRLTAPKPFKPTMVAKIKSFELTADCEATPDGRTYAALFKVSVVASAFFKTFEDTESRRIILHNP